MKKRRIMEVLSFSRGERLRQAVVSHADTTKKAIVKAKKNPGKVWIESVDAPATRTEQGGYKVHYM